MMRKSVLVSLVLGLSLAAACGKVEEKGAGYVEAASKKASDAYDELSNLTPEAAKQKVDSLVSQAKSLPPGLGELLDWLEHQASQ